MRVGVMRMRVMRLGVSDGSESYSGSDEVRVLGVMRVRGSESERGSDEGESGNDEVRVLGVMRVRVMGVRVSESDESELTWGKSVSEYNLGVRVRVMRVDMGEECK